MDYSADIWHGLGLTLKYLNLVFYMAKVSIFLNGIFYGWNSSQKSKRYQTSSRNSYLNSGQKSSQVCWLSDPIREFIKKQSILPITRGFFQTCFKLGKVEKILKGSQDSMPSPWPSVKTQIMGGKVCLRCKGKTLLVVVNKLLKTKSLLTSPSTVLPHYLK